MFARAHRTTSVETLFKIMRIYKYDAEEDADEQPVWHSKSGGLAFPSQPLVTFSEPSGQGTGKGEVFGASNAYACLDSTSSSIR